MLAGNIRSAEVELPCPDLAEGLRVFGKLGFVVEMIMPADDPQIAVIAGHGLRLRLVANTRKPPGSIRLVCRDPRQLGDGHLIAGGVRIDLVAETGAALVLVTHDEALAARADRTVRLRDGRVADPSAIPA